MTTVLKVTEKEWQQTVVDTARAFGWRVYHTFDSRNSAPGFPDLVMVRRGRLVFAELKSAHGKLSMPQTEWLMALASVAPAGVGDEGLKTGRGVGVFVWHPRDWPEVERTLR
jgi:hypothetical protein